MRLANCGLLMLAIVGLGLSTPVPADTELKASNILDGTPTTSGSKPIAPKYKIDSTASATSSANPKILFNNKQEIMKHERRKVEYEGNQYLMRV
ncbi:hypothetical protein Cantr_03870 [Candida viswanathii]|uniref:Uncharacterized protein n=1 Tax=Candida viswanathii TaxID=5486 RepID=A0A367XNE7_9ASCO|nr:hypothetical protein Cantr_03870 [Candida viswanathii]